MQKWEYCYIEVPISYSGNTTFLSTYCLVYFPGTTKPEQRLREHLLLFIAELGEQGWEMVGYSGTPHQKPSNYFFKRPRSDE
ncbi:MAG: hypothetical protein MUE40_21135 [Anaerolineae bacterium]|jgi:hypothetical protein|nr:hypothetical protein [Anaerolineae bacterium]